jgi:hypothetical protein
VCSDAADPPDIDLKSQYVAAVLINSDASISLNYRLNSRVSDMDGPKPENNGAGADSPISGRLLGAPPGYRSKTARRRRVSGGCYANIGSARDFAFRIAEAHIS